MKEQTELNCLRCSAAITYAGRKKFHEGINWGFLGDLMELFECNEVFDIYYCSNCGKVEFFVDVPRE